jgi:hypothetical protein
VAAMIAAIVPIVWVLAIFTVAGILGDYYA